MPISSLADLRLQIDGNLVGHFSGPDDVRIDGFISLAEAEINRRLRVREQITRGTSLVVNQYVALPADFLQAINVTLLGDCPHPLDVITEDRADRERRRMVGLPPRYFVISGMEMEVVPAPSAAGSEVEMVFYSKVPALTDDAPSNWLLTKAPDLYLNAALAAASPFVVDVDRGPFWRSETVRIIEDMNAEAQATRFSGSPLRMKTRRVYR